jgi:hypothetical protein
MSHAEVCPVCKGTGNIHTSDTATGAGPVKCHGCFGLGWVTVYGSDPPPILPTIWPRYDYGGTRSPSSENYTRCMMQ